MKRNITIGMIAASLLFSGIQGYGMEAYAASGTEEIQSMTLAEDQGVPVNGILVLGHERRLFTPALGEGPYWVLDDTGRLLGAYDFAANVETKSGRPVYAEMNVVDAGRADDGFAKAYDSVYRVKSIRKIQSMGSMPIRAVLFWDTASFKIVAERNMLTIEPEGLAAVNRKETQDILGYSVTGMEVGDLNQDGWPEVFVYLTSHGSGSYGKLAGYSVNNGKSMSQVYLPTVEVEKESRAREGYRGHDRMKIDGEYLTVTFPVYRETDSNALPTGGERILRYRLKDGEAGRQFELVDIQNVPKQEGKSTEKNT